jgi:hypothetical protein
MKFEMKSLVIAAALVAAGAANAAIITAKVGTPLVVFDPAGSGRAAELTVLAQSGGALEFSNGTGVPGGVPTDTVGGLVGALNVAAVVLNPIDGAKIDEQMIDIQGDLTRGVVKIGASVTNLVANDQTGQILTVGSLGGAQQVAARISGVLNGGEMNVSNLRFDLANKTVIADVAGTPLVYNATTKVWAPGTQTVQKDLTLWTITDIVGPTVIRPEALLAAGAGDFSKMQADGYKLLSTAPSSDPRFPLYTVSATNVLGGLKVTDAGFAFFANALGLKAGSTGYTTLSGVNSQPDGWGSISSSIVFTAREIPEPSTYALMGLGLVGISLVARRRAK